MANVDKDYFQIDENIKQNRIEDILMEEEEILVRLTPDKKTYKLESIFKGLPLTLLWGGVDGFAIYMIFSGVVETDLDGFLIPFLIFFFALHLIPVWMYVANIVKTLAGYKNIEYVFTDKRIIIRSGLIGIDFKNIYYEEIQSITVKVGLWDRLFKVGDLYITTANQTGVIEDIKAPYHYCSKIQEIVRDLKADMAFPNDLRPEENHGYNTKYKK